MKVRSSIKRLCNYCILIKRQNKKYICCSKTCKHKQRQK